MLFANDRELRIRASYELTNVLACAWYNEAYDNHWSGQLNTVDIVFNL